jgi:hypothetical protein
MGAWSIWIGGPMRPARQSRVTWESSLEQVDRLGATILDEGWQPTIGDTVHLVEEADIVSDSLVTMGLGTKTWTIPAGQAIAVGEWLRIHRRADAGVVCEGIVTSYSGTALVVDVQETAGSGTYSDWAIARRLFTGPVLERTVKGTVSRPESREIEITAHSGAVFAERRLVNLVLGPGTVKSALQQLLPYLSPFGVSLDPNQADGPTIGAIPASFVTVRAALDALSAASGWRWDLNPHYRLSMRASAYAAPWGSVTEDATSITRGDVSVTRTQQDYANRVLVRYDHDQALATAEDLTGQSQYGIWEAVLSASDVTDATVAQAIADQYLARHNGIRIEVSYRTIKPGLRAFQSQTISIPSRGVVNEPCIIREVRCRHVTGDVVEREITAVSVLAGEWRDVYRAWASGGANAGVVGGGGGGGSQEVSARWVFLGGSASESIYVADTGWHAASPFAVDLTVSSAAAQSAVVTALVRSSASGGPTLTARLFNLTDGVSAGTSSPIGAQGWGNWIKVQFPVTLVLGTRTYRIELQSSAANAELAAWAYLE